MLTSASSVIGRRVVFRKPLLATGALWSRGVVVSAQTTPNPDSVMFYPGAREVLGSGKQTMQFKSKYDANITDSPLASALFKVNGVHEILLGAQHVTVTKKASTEWDMLQPNVELVMSQFFAAGLQPVKAGCAKREAAAELPEEGSVEAQIMEVLEDRVKPFVQQDGGDIEYQRFDAEEGVVYLKMQGACAGCPKSSITLQHGIKQLLQHYVEEVQDVIAVEDDEDDAIPRGHN